MRRVAGGTPVKIRPSNCAHRLFGKQKSSLGNSFRMRRGSQPCVPVKRGKGAVRGAELHTLSLAAAPDTTHPSPQPLSAARGKARVLPKPEEVNHEQNQYFLSPALQ